MIFPSPIHAHFSAPPIAIPCRTTHALVIITPCFCCYCHAHLPTQTSILGSFCCSHQNPLICFCCSVDFISSFRIQLKHFLFPGTFFDFLLTPQLILIQVQISDGFQTALLCSHSSLACKYFHHCVLPYFL